MFTGLIEAVGEIAAVEPHPGGLRLHVATHLAGELTPGDSLAVNGVCLTVTTVADGGIYADIGPETARVTTLGALQPRGRVNLERSMRADSRFGGHFVQGHVDGTGTVRRITAEGDAHWLAIGFDEALAGYLIPKGSIAVDGISLTIASIRPSTSLPSTSLGTRPPISAGASPEFEVMIIPFTWEHTNVPTLRPGSAVNLECDMIGKYVARAAALAAAKAPAVPEETR